MNKLPEHWYIKITPENKKTISNWRTCGVLSSTGSGYCLSKGHPNSLDGHIGYYLRDKPNIGVEITFDQFKELVLGEKVSYNINLNFVQL